MVIAPQQVLQYYEYFAVLAGIDDIVSFVPTVNTLYAGSTTQVCQATGGIITRLRSVAVEHCRFSYAAVIDLYSGFKIVYSGDCRPSQSIITAGAGCDLLIHEATFDDSMGADALSKRHCTTSEAVGVGTSMRAKHCVLTHFSQRYPSSSPHQLSLSSPSFPKAAFSTSFDFLRFAYPSQIASLPRTTRLLCDLYDVMDSE